VARQPSPPPSLSRIPGATSGCILNPACGLGNCIDRPGVLLDECSARGKLRQLEQQIGELPLKKEVGNVKIKIAARSLLMAAWEVGAVRRMARRRLRKSGLKDKNGRPREEVGDYVGIVAALDYEKLTGSRVSRKIVQTLGRTTPLRRTARHMESGTTFWRKFFQFWALTRRPMASISAFRQI
jgi:hypothetical protein